MMLSIEKLATRLKAKGLKICTAESCTGGGLSYFMTSIPGSSDWFERGFVTYSNASKMEMLGVKQITLDSFGAVSEPTVIEMAEGALKHSHADISVAITGIAGPDGGTPSKPVGTVWIAFAQRGTDTRAMVDLYTGTRESIRGQVIKRACDELLKL